MAGWQDWIGRQMRQDDVLGTSLARRWLATFDLPLPAGAQQGCAMAQGIHFCLCTPEAPTAMLGTDGHPRRSEDPGSFLPPLPFERRMWAASDIRFHAPLRIGDTIERTSSIASIAQKEGRSGPLAFVEVEHRTLADGTLAIEERQSLVYRPTAERDAPLSPPPPGAATFDRQGWDAVRTLIPDEILLFRFSALSFNTHRIHYDAPYARQVERYRGLVVHGPLMASLLLQMAARHLRENGAGGEEGMALARFSFRATSPAIAGEELHLALREDAAAGTLELGCFARDGRQILAASAASA